MVVALVCGGGNAAHVLTGVAASNPNTEVRTMSLYADESERWAKAMEGHPLTITAKAENKTYTPANPVRVNKDPAVQVPGCDIIVLSVPAFAHAQYLSAIAPYVKDGAVIVGLPGYSGFDFAAFGCLGEKSKKCSIMAFESLPWACRLEEYGRAATIFGTKDVLQGAVLLGNPRPPMDPVQMMQTLLGERPVLKTQGHLLGMTLLDGYFHGAIMYGQWHKFDGKPLDKAPLFYQGVDKLAADLMEAVSEEYMVLAKAITSQRPDVDLSLVEPVYGWIKRVYGEQIQDSSCMMRCLQTNKAYEGLLHPVIETEDGKFMPNFKYRYLTEDIPYGLAVVRGVAEIMNVATPKLDQILLWGQGVLGKEYLHDGKMKGKHLGETRAPQRFGITTLDGILGR